MKDYAKGFYLSQAWQTTRNAYFKHRHGLCEKCLQKGLYVPGVIVHHREHLTPENITDERIALSFDNLQLVCRSCHALEHGTEKEKRYVVDAWGRVDIKE